MMPLSASCARVLQRHVSVAARAPFARVSIIANNNQMKIRHLSGGGKKNALFETTCTSNNSNFVLSFNSKQAPILALASASASLRSTSSIRITSFGTLSPTANAMGVKGSLFSSSSRRFFSASPSGGASSAAAVLTATSSTSSSSAGATTTEAAAVANSIASTSTGDAAAAASSAAAPFKPVISGILENYMPSFSSVPTNGSFPDLSITVSTLDGSTGLTGLAWDTLTWLHTGPLGLEWWAAIATASLALRIVVFPLFIKAVKTGAWMNHHNEALSQFAEQMTLAQQKKDSEAMRVQFYERRSFMARHGLQMRWILLPTLVQFPLFITFFSTLRAMAREAHLLPGISTGGIPSWFPALHLPDPTGILPITSAVLSAAAISINSNMQGIPQLNLTPGGQKVIFAGLSVLFNVVAFMLPSGIQTYIAITSATMVIQQIILRAKLMRNLMGFPHDWPISPTVIAERAKRRGALGAQANPMVGAMKSFEPMFIRASNIAAGKWRAEPVHEYVSVGGLRNPGAPLPPPVMEGMTMMGVGSSSSGSNGANIAKIVATSTTLSPNDNNNSVVAASGTTKATTSPSSSTIAPQQNQQIFTSQKPVKKKK